LGGRQALTLLLASKPYDFVFCDLMIGDIGGAQLYAAEGVRTRAGAQADHERARG
jgi:hypothetical protein